MLGTATRVLRLVFDRETAAQIGSRDLPVIDVVGYCEDFVFSGLLSLDADRLTDLLNGCDQLELVDVVVRWLKDGLLTQQPTTLLPRSSVLAVKAGPPRGRRERRKRTRPMPAVGLSGPYSFEGYVHTRPGGDAAASLARHQSMIPLTDATVRFAMAGEDYVEEAKTLIVNRDAAVSLRPASHGDRIALSATA